MPRAGVVGRPVALADHREVRDPAAALEARRNDYALFDGPRYDHMLSRRVRDMPRALGRIDPG